MAWRMGWHADSAQKETRAIGAAMAGGEVAHGCGDLGNGVTPEMIQREHRVGDGPRVIEIGSEGLEVNHTCGIPRMTKDEESGRRPIHW